jgi:alanine racemase
MMLEPDFSEIERQGRLTIDLGAVVHNWNYFRAQASQAVVASVVKANAYGLGIEAIVSALRQAGCTQFFVATVEEGLRVRAVAPNALIFVFEGLLAANIPHYISGKLVPIIGDLGHLQTWCARTESEDFGLHLETGINRYGLNEAEIASAMEVMAARSRNPCLLISHFACADMADHVMNLRQIDQFEKLTAAMPNIQRSLCNSAGVFLGPAAHHQQVRAGIGLYGGLSRDLSNDILKPVVRMEVKIMQIKHITKGEAVGYGASHHLKRDTKLAICGAGYADGIMRSISSFDDQEKPFYGALGGERVPLIGRVSMDAVAFDVTDIAPEQIGRTDWVELIGQCCPLEEFAQAANTISYEILTRLGNRFQRKYVFG